MNGIEILATKEVATGYDFNLVACLIVGCIIFSIFIIMGVVISVKSCDWSNLTIGALFGLFLSTIVGFAIGYAFETPAGHETQYKVIISDEVSMNDFNSKYEIIDQEGKIYTIRERN